VRVGEYTKVCGSDTDGR